MKPLDNQWEMTAINHNENLEGNEDGFFFLGWQEDDTRPNWL